MNATMGNGTPAVTLPRRQRRMFPVTELRLSRLKHGLRLSDVAARAGMTLTRASFIERDPSIGTPEELAAITSAIDALAGELQQAGGAA